MQRRKILDIVIALLCAVLLWIYVVTVVTPEDDLTIYDIPVVFVGESELRSEYNLILSNQSATAVTVKFHGSRAALRQLREERDNITVTLDVTGYTTEREYSATYTVKLPSALQDNSITVTDRSPRTIQFTVEKRMTKTVPVKGVFDGTTAEGFAAGELRFDQDSITLTGPADEVERVSYAQVVVGGADVSETIDTRVSYTLIGADGEPIYSENITTDAADIGVQVPIQTEKTVPLTVTLVSGAGAAESNTTVTIEPQELTLSGEASVLAEIEAIDLGALELALIPDGTLVQLPISLPEGAQAQEAATVASVRVRYSGLATQDVPVSEIAVTGLASGMSAVLEQTELTVTLRGESARMAQESEWDVSASVDLTEYLTAGSYTVPVTIRTPDGVGAVGEYTVTVELS